MTKNTSKTWWRSLSNDMQNAVIARSLKCIRDRQQLTDDEIAVIWEKERGQAL